MHYKKNKEGLMEAWSEDYTPTKGMIRGQTIFGHCLKVFTPEQWAKEEAASLAAKETQRIKKEEEEAKRKKIEKYFFSLPPTIAGYHRDCENFDPHELSDEYGNYVISLPERAGEETWSISVLEEWVRGKLRKRWEEEE